VPDKRSHADPATVRVVEYALAGSAAVYRLITTITGQVRRHPLRTWPPSTPSGGGWKRTPVMRVRADHPAEPAKLRATTSLRSRDAMAIRRSQARTGRMVTGQPNRCTPGQLPLRNTGEILKSRIPGITRKTKLSGRAYHNQN
jgi:hypothetical protein